EPAVEHQAADERERADAEPELREVVNDEGGDVDHDQPDGCERADRRDGPAAKAGRDPAPPGKVELAASRATGHGLRVGGAGHGWTAALWRRRWRTRAGLRRA